MSTLHIVNKPPQQTCIEECLRVVSNGDGILLIEDGVYAADNHFSDLFSGKDIQVFALENDVKARGLSDRLYGNIKVIDDSDFVDKVVEFSKSHSWY